MEKRFVFLLAVFLVSMIFVATAHAGSVSNYKFTGKELDGETNFEYFGARYYDQNRGRFISIDPALLESAELQKILSDPQQLNGYAYARNNPLRFLDDIGKKVSEFQPYLPRGTAYRLGDVLGVYRGVTLMSGGSVTGSDANPYQCTDVAKTFVRNQYSVELGGTGPAVNYGRQDILGRNYSLKNPNNPGSYVVYRNGGSVMPQENDLISWSGGASANGHVGVIVEVTFDDKAGSGYVYSIEQNVNRAQALFVQSLSQSYDNNGRLVYMVGDRLRGYHVQAWGRYENQSTDHPPQIYTSIPYTPAPKKPLNK